MEIARIIATEANPAAAAGRVRAAFGAAGWHEIGATLVFTRGSRLGSVVGLSPAWWRARAMATVLPAGGGARVDLRVTVSATLQVISELEREFWEQEIGALAASLTGGPSLQGGRMLAARAFRQNIAADAILLGVPAACALAPWLWFDSLQGFLVGAIVGAIAGVAWAVWRMKLRVR